MTFVLNNKNSLYIQLKNDLLEEEALRNSFHVFVVVLRVFVCYLIDILFSSPQRPG